MRKHGTKWKKKKAFETSENEYFSKKDVLTYWIWILT